MPTNKQRRDAARRHLERQLQRRVEREAARKRFTLIASIVGTVALIAVVVAVIIAVGHDKSSKAPAADGTSLPTSTPSQSASPTPSTSYPPAKGAAVSFEGVKVTGAADLKGVPTVTSKSAKQPAKLLVKDLVVGTGKAATPNATVTVQYIGQLYKDGTTFDASWTRGEPATFGLGPGKVIDGFTQGIGGTTGVAPMKVGGRRIIIMPSTLGYGAQGNQAIPPNSPLVFVVDLKAVA